MSISTQFQLLKIKRVVVFEFWVKLFYVTSSFGELVIQSAKSRKVMGTYFSQKNILPNYGWEPLNLLSILFQSTKKTVYFLTFCSWTPIFLQNNKNIDHLDFNNIAWKTSKKEVNEILETGQERAINTSH